MENLIAKSLIGLALIVVLSVLSWIVFVNHVSVNHVGVAYNSMNGSLTVQTNAGFYVTSPFTKVVTLDLLPQMVSIPSVARVITTKYVRLRPEKVLDFVKLQGFSYDLNQNQNNIMMGYSFSGKRFDFIEVVQEGGPETFTR